jgi:hypothetical protein
MAPVTVRRILALTYRVWRRPRPLHKLFFFPRVTPTSSLLVSPISIVTWSSCERNRYLSIKEVNQPWYAARFLFDAGSMKRSQDTCPCSCSCGSQPVGLARRKLSCECGVQCRSWSAWSRAGESRTRHVFHYVSLFSFLCIFPYLSSSHTFFFTKMNEFLFTY